MNLEALIANTKARREAAGLVSTYVGQDGKPYAHHHPNAAVKAFWDYRYELKTKYGNVQSAPAEDLKRLEVLYTKQRFPNRV